MRFYVPLRLSGSSERSERACGFFGFWGEVDGLEQQKRGSRGGAGTRRGDFDPYQRKSLRLDGFILILPGCNGEAENGSHR